jgi:tetratricopeptide (TPR) repeat protein
MLGRILVGWKMKKACLGSSSLILAGLMAFILSFSGLAMPSPTLSANDAVKEWESLQISGTKAFEANEFGKAERLLTEAVAKARGLGTEELRLARSVGELGRLLTVRARFAEAEPYLEEELRLKERVIGTDSGKIIPAMGEMIKFYLTYGTARRADRVTEDLLFLVEGKMRDEISRIKASSKVQKGAPLQGWAGTADPGMHGPLIEWAITCDEIGNLYSSHGKYDYAERLFKAALDAKAAVLGKQHLSLANSYDSLGVLCLAKDENAEAESFLKESLEITERIQYPEDPQIYARLDKLARCLIKEKKYGEAEQLYLQANRLWEKEPSKCGNEARCLFALGCLYSDQKRYAAAAPLLRRSLLMSERFNGDWSVSIVPYLRKYAYVLYYLGRRGETSLLRARADRISPEVKALKTTCKTIVGDWTKRPGEVKSKSASKQKSAKSSKRRGKHKSGRRPRNSRQMVGTCSPSPLPLIIVSVALV